MASKPDCSECGQELGIPRIAKLDEDGRALCEDCAPGDEARSADAA